ncbi:MAG: tRNA (adenosine(37)-N6)-threonylcarbamoyltransferase complex ATPase subunit type 1 TsaE [Oligoflexia bacterium]|nr:tRNA (adenosine(37)-N6)-threonylcarbamoyltransferase complex ATPase subunit type 1 TsaE [Oligoflexia bacterium]
MPSKTSKPRPKPSRPEKTWKAVRGCSEQALIELAGQLGPELKPGDRVLLEGSLGAGKTTFARALLRALGVIQPPEGSPTFAIAHEYETASRVGVVHVDLYRLKSEAEIDEAGIPDYFWDPSRIVICEWLSMWSDFERAVLKSGRNWRVSLEASEDVNSRDVLITRPGP